MNSLRVRLTLWFTLSFLAVSGVFMFLTYQKLDSELSREAWGAENKPPPDWILRGSVSEKEIDEIKNQLLVSTLTFSGPLLLVLLFLGYLVARKSLSPIDRLNAQLQSVGARNLGQRVRLPEADEQFRDLVDHLNDMLARLEGSFREMSDYAAKVAHELRTPLTIIRLKLEQSEGRIDPELAEEVQAELHRLHHVVEQSLLIAKAEQGRLSWQNERFDLSVVIAEVANDFRLLAEESGRDLQLEVDPACVVESDPRYARQILHALLTNALTHGRDTIHIRLHKSRGAVRCLMANRIRPRARPTEHTLGLGLRVVQALIGSQATLGFRQHRGAAWYATRLSLPAVAVPAKGVRPPVPVGDFGI
jgi:signal transduction histidine kinase